MKVPKPTKTDFGSRALVLPPFKLYIKKHSFLLSKIMKINQDIVNDVIYTYAEIYYKILCIVIYTKITKSDKICGFEIYILRSRHLLFLCSPKYKVLEQDFLHVGWI
jgi:hypothetical protein